MVDPPPRHSRSQMDRTARGRAFTRNSRATSPDDVGRRPRRLDRQRPTQNLTGELPQKIQQRSGAASLPRGRGANPPVRIREGCELNRGGANWRVRRPRVALMRRTAATFARRRPSASRAVMRSGQTPGTEADPLPLALRSRSRASSKRPRKNSPRPRRQKRQTRLKNYPDSRR